MSKSASEVLAELREIVVVSRDDAWKAAMAAKSNDCEYLACNERGQSQAYHRVVLLIDELSTSDDEQTHPGLLPCPFCGEEAVEVVCPWSSEEVAITCPSNNCLVFGRKGIGDRKLIYGPRWAAINWWNTRANKTQ